MTAVGAERESPGLRDVASPIVRFARGTGGMADGMDSSRDGKGSDLVEYGARPRLPAVCPTKRISRPASL